MLLEILQIGQPHIRVKRVGAGLQNVEAALGTLGRDHRLEVRIEQRPTEILQFFDKRLVSRELVERSMASGLKGRALQLVESEIRQELLRGGVIVIAPV